MLTEVSLRVRAAPSTGVYEGMFFASFAEGVEAIRRLAGEHSLPDVVRLSDERETQLSLMLAEQGPLKGALTRAYMGVRGVAGGCLAILGFEGSEEEVALRRSRAKELLRRHGGRPAGGSPGHAWLRGRFAGPYLRDDLLGQGVMAETLETAAQWSKLLEVHDAVAGRDLEGPLAAGHSGDRDVPRLPRVRDGRLALLHAARPPARGTGDRPVAGGQAGGGGRDPRQRRDHHPPSRDRPRPRPLAARERSPATGVATLRAAKAELDPTGIMNPGKLLGGREPIRG